MESEDETFYDDVDSENESSGDEIDSSIIPQEKAIETDEYSFEVLSTEEIVQHMADTIKEVNTVVEIPATTTRILLNHFKWDKQKLMERFYDGDQDKLFAEAHVVNPFEKSTPINDVCSTQNSISRFNVTDAAQECGICFLTLSPQLMSGLECGHKFCSNCWVEYLRTKIMKEGMCQTISCAAHDCDILVDDASVMRLVKDPRVRLKYQHLITNNFVECNKLLRWCRSPHCNNVIKVQYVESKPVTCKCNDTFCFDCGENWHEPVNCKFLRKWIKKCNDDSETSNWIIVNTKECPSCKATIEKNGGCNHITCTNKNCRFEFCWICLKSWVTHAATRVCNKFIEGKEKNVKKSQQNSRAALVRYLFYCNRYMNHMQSLKFENKLYESVKEKMVEMQRYNMSWIDVQFLKQGVDILCSCRQALMYSYVFAFYAEKNNQTLIFESNQNDLETATEVLSEYLERDITGENLVDIKRKVQDKYQYCEIRRKHLFEHVSEGYEKGWWEFVD